MTNDEAIDILVVEDITNGRPSIAMTLEAAVPLINIVAVSNGESAIDLLLNRGEWSGRDGVALPRFVLLDLQRADEDAVSLLGEIASFDVQMGMNIAPIVEFTQGHVPGSAARTYHCGADGYAIAPLSYTDTPAVVEAVGNHWHHLNDTAEMLEDAL